LATSAGSGGGQPAVDGQNTVLFAPHGFAPAGNALAITLLSYDELTGNIVDADIVINGIHPFALLPPGAQPASGAAPVSTEGASSKSSGESDDHSNGHSGDSAKHSNAFDLEHVVSHEVGHTLGLGDVQDNHSALMYAYSTPGDASMRAPSGDEADAMDTLYGGSVQSAGCGHASVAGARPLASDVWATLALWMGAGAWIVSRRRARVFVPMAIALVALVAHPDQARSAPLVVPAFADATAHVVAASTRNVGGVFETTLELAPYACRVTTCPAHAQARVWGGTIGGITQVVGDLPAPSPGDVVRVSFAAATSDVAESEAAVIGQQP
jgi:hypothetical protein